MGTTQSRGQLRGEPCCAASSTGQATPGLRAGGRARVIRLLQLSEMPCYIVINFRNTQGWGLKAAFPPLRRTGTLQPFHLG